MIASDALTCWGDDSYGQVSKTPSGTYKAVAAGDWHSCAIAGNGNVVRCWGVYTGFDPSGSFKAVSSGFSHSCAIRTNDTITCWGNNAYSKANAPSGDLQGHQRRKPAQLRNHEHRHHHLLGQQHPRPGRRRAHNGHLQGCQLRRPAQLRNRQRRHHHLLGPQRQQPAPPHPQATYKAVAAGAAHNCAIASDDTITCWGDNGDNRATAPSGTYKSVTAGSRHSCAIGSDDTISCWGLSSVAAVPEE